MYFLLRIVPKSYISFLVGKLVAIPLPGALAERSIRWFAERYGLNLEEAEKPVSEYRSIADFFVRNLKPGLRPVAEAAVVSPVDGNVVQAGKISGDRILQVKGREYSVGELLKDEHLSAKFEDGFFATFYLAPHNYHHIHAPVDGEIKDTYYIRGHLWPVNSWSVENIDGLFTVNERITTVIESNVGTVAVVMVGATNVGAIRLSYDDIRANACPSVFVRPHLAEHRHYETGKPIKRGERIGTFAMGSTVIVLFEAGKTKLSAETVLGSKQFGERLV